MCFELATDRANCALDHPPSYTSSKSINYQNRSCLWVSTAFLAEHLFSYITTPTNQQNRRTASIFVPGPDCAEFYEVVQATRNKQAVAVILFLYCYLGAHFSGLPYSVFPIF